MFFDKGEFNIVGISYQPRGTRTRMHRVVHDEIGTVSYGLPYVHREILLDSPSQVKK